MLDLEIGLIQLFNWSLKDIDETDIESLIPFIFKISGIGKGPKPRRRIFCDEASWLL